MNTLLNKAGRIFQPVCIQSRYILPDIDEMSHTFSDECGTVYGQVWQDEPISFEESQRCECIYNTR